MISPTVGGGGGSSSSFNCPAGAYINKIDGRVSDVIEKINFTCSDGTKSKTFGEWDGDKAFTISGAIAGATGLYGGNYVDSMTLTAPDNTSYAKVGGSGGTRVYWAGCPTNAKVSGVNVRSAKVVDRLQFICSQFDPPVTTTPVVTTPVVTTPVVTTPVVTTPVVTTPVVTTATNTDNTTMYIFMAVFILFVALIFLVLKVVQDDDSPNNIPDY